MPLDLDGDTIVKFGDRLPVPYIEKIIVHDAKISIKISFYIEGVVGQTELSDSIPFEDTIYTEYLQSLKDLKLVLINVSDGIVNITNQSILDGTDTLIQQPSWDTTLVDPIDTWRKYGPIQTGDNGTNLFNRLLSQEISVLDLIKYDPRDLSELDKFETWIYDHLLAYDTSYYADPAAMLIYKDAGVEDIEGEEGTTPATFSGAPLHPNNSNVLIYRDIDFVAGEWSRETLYKSDGTPVNRFTNTYDIIDTGVTPLEDSVASFVSSMQLGVTNRFVAFTTSIENIRDYDPDLTQELAIINKTAEGRALDLQISDYCYETVSLDGSIQSEETVIFKYPDGSVFYGEPIQAIDSIYYGDASVSYADIVSTFNDLIGTTNNSDLQDKFDNLAFILSVYGHHYDILPRINKFRKTFLQTSTATEVGRFHEKLEIRLFNTNNAIKRGVKINKFSNLNPVVIDSTATTLSTFEYIPPSYSESEYGRRKANQFIYNDRVKMGAYALPEGQEWDNASAQAAWENATAGLNAAMTNAHAALQYTVQRFYSLLDKIQIEILNGWSGFAIQSTADKSYFGTIYSYDTDGKRRKNKKIKYHKFEWRMERVVPDYEEDGWWEEAFEDLLDFLIAIPASFIPGQLPPGAAFTVNFVEFDRDLKGMKNEVVSSEQRGWWNIFRYGTTMYSAQNRSYTDSAGWSTPTDVDDDALNSNYMYDLPSWKVRGLDEIEIQCCMEDFPIAREGDIGPPLMYAGDTDTVEETYSWTTNTPDRTNRRLYTAVYKKHKMKYEGEDDHHTINWDPEANGVREQYDAYIAGIRAYISAISKVAIMMDMQNESWEVALLNADVYYTQYNLYLQGFYIFDYEKALCASSNISQILDVKKIESHFGRELTHSHYYLEEATLAKYYDTWFDTHNIDLVPTDIETNEPFGELDPYVFVKNLRGNVHDDYGKYQGKIITTFDTSTSAAPPTTKQTIEATDPNAANFDNPYNDGELMYASSDAIGYPIGTTIKQTGFHELMTKYNSTSLTTRNFALTDNDIFDQYRVVCFEFSDVAGPFNAASPEDTSGTNLVNAYSYGSDLLYTINQAANYYLPNVKVRDLSLEIYSHIVKTYEQIMLSEYEEYWERAVEECSYNNSDETFNKFFIDGILGKYSDIPHNAPWFLAPIAYHSNLDIVTNRYKGDKEAIKAAALLDMERIHPRIANLEQLWLFRTKIRAFYEKYYDYAASTTEGGLVSRMVKTRNMYDSQHIFGHEDYTDSMKFPTIRDLPVPVNVDYLGYSSMTGDMVTVDFEDIAEDVNNL